MILSLRLRQFRVDGLQERHGHIRIEVACLYQRPNE
jgi:hypothetical protein